MEVGHVLREVQRPKGEALIFIGRVEHVARGIGVAREDHGIECLCLAIALDHLRLAGCAGTNGLDVSCWPKHRLQLL